MEKFTIPEKCNDCGIQCDISKDMAELLLEKTVTRAVAEELVGESGAEMDEKVEGLMRDPEIAKSLTAKFRQQTGNELEEMDEAEEMLRELSASHALSCDGVLKMRAAKAGKTYLVNVCTSARAYDINSETPNHLSTHVTVTTPKV